MLYMLSPLQLVDNTRPCSSPEVGAGARPPCRPGLHEVAQDGSVAVEGRVPGHRGRARPHLRHEHRARGRRRLCRYSDSVDIMDRYCGVDIRRLSAVSRLY